MDIKLDEITLETLAELEKTQKEFWNIPRETGILINTFLKMMNIQNALEIGTSNGYSGIWITKALKEKRKVELTYLSSDGVVRIRIIHPHDLYVHEHNWYIPAYCQYCKSMRHFQFKNVKDIKILDDFFD